MKHGGTAEFVTRFLSYSKVGFLTQKMKMINVQYRVIFQLHERKNVKARISQLSAYVGFLLKVTRSTPSSALDRPQRWWHLAVVTELAGNTTYVILDITREQE